MWQDPREVLVHVPLMTLMVRQAELKPSTSGVQAKCIIKKCTLLHQYRLSKHQNMLLTPIQKHQPTPSPSTMSTDTEQPTTPNPRTILSYLVPSLAHCQIGFSTISISGFQAMTGFLRTYGHLDASTPTGWNMGLIPQQLAASFVNFGTMLGILSSYLLRNHLSRRHGLWLACVLSVIGSGLQLKHSAVGGLYARRAIIGLSNGLFMGFANTYTAETAPAHLKERVTSLFAVWLCAGGVLGAVTNNFTQGLGTSWAFKIPLTCHITIPSLLFILVTFIPESPRWLLARGRGDAARVSLTILRGHAQPTSQPQSAIEKEIQEIQTSISSQRKSKTRYLQLKQYRSLFNPTNRLRTLLCLALILTNSTSGIWLMLSYGTVFFQLSFVPLPFHASIYSNVANLFGSLIGVYLSAKMLMRRRKVVMIFGYLVQAGCMLGVGLTSSVVSDSKGAGMVILVCVLMHGFAYFAFSAALSSKLAGEIVDSAFQGKAVGLGTGVNYATACKFSHLEFMSISFFTLCDVILNGMERSDISRAHRLHYALFYQYERTELGSQSGVYMGCFEFHRLW